MGIGGGEEMFKFFLIIFPVGITGKIFLFNHGHPWLNKKNCQQSFVVASLQFSKVKYQQLSKQ